MFYLDRPTSEEFYEVYKVLSIFLFRIDDLLKPIVKKQQINNILKGVIPEYSAMAEHLTTGPCLALEIRFDFDFYWKNKNF